MRQFFLLRERIFKIINQEVQAERLEVLDTSDEKSSEQNLQYIDQVAINEKSKRITLSNRNKELSNWF